MKLDSETRANALALMRRALTLFEQLYGTEHTLSREIASLVVELQHDVQLEESMETAPRPQPPSASRTRPRPTITEA